MMNGRIVEKKEIAPNIYRLLLEAPTIAQRAKPGQFVIIISDTVGERIPFTLSDWDSKAGTITIFFSEVGVSTMKLANMKTDDIVHAIVGPLGRPTNIEKVGTVVVGGGCYGIGAIYPLAKTFKEKGNKVIGVIEARTKYLFYNIDKLREVTDELLFTTSDGSKGLKGHVQDGIKMLANRGERIDHAHFVGCTFMMMLSSEATKPLKIPTIVSLNSLMVDGTGMCGCCRVIVGGETKFACVDGPNFNGHEVDWDMVAAREGSYVSEETLAYQFYQLRESVAAHKDHQCCKEIST
ncbi:MAG: sulfide/dihydroorotate dehydrogenase-like FAD/NAD-binding protein [Candidatus Bathyarchaeota archaeon]